MSYLTCDPGFTGVDLLHQLHKSIFKDQLIQWCMQIMGEKELDKQFKAMNGYPGLHHFKKGILSVSQWTGTEHKEMEKVLLGITIGCVPSHFIPVVCSLVDFIYLSQLQLQTLTILNSLELCFNTESPEHLHINLAKEAYHASNKRDYVKQMAIWLQESYLIWVEKRLLSMIRMSEDSMMEEEEDVQVQLINPINVTQCDLNMNQHDINITDSRDKNLNKFNNTIHTLLQSNLHTQILQLKILLRSSVL